MKYFIEIAPPTGSKDVQYIGVLGDGIFVVDSETPGEAEEKLFDLLAGTMKTVVNRPATEDEVEAFTKYHKYAETAESMQKIKVPVDEHTS